MQLRTLRTGSYAPVCSVPEACFPIVYMSLWFHVSRDL